MQPGVDPDTTIATTSTASVAAGSFRFFPVERALQRHVSYLYSSQVSRDFAARMVGSRIPELEPQLVFAIEEGSEFPGGLALGGGLSASLFVQHAHLEIIGIPDTIREVVGASLRPEGACLLMPRGTRTFGLGARTPIVKICGASGRHLLEQMAAAPLARKLELLGAYLSERASQARPPHAVVSKALRFFREGHGLFAVEDVAARCGVTSRTLQKVLIDEIGLAPKQVARIERLRQALILLQRECDSLSKISASSEFCDQAHMCREFRSLLRMTPRKLRRAIRARGQQATGYATDRDLLSTGLLILPRTETLTER